VLVNQQVLARQKGYSGIVVLQASQVPPSLFMLGICGRHGPLCRRTTVCCCSHLLATSSSLHITLSISSACPGSHDACKSGGQRRIQAPCQPMTHYPTTSSACATRHCEEQLCTGRASLMDMRSIGQQDTGHTWMPTSPKLLNVEL
jgi:hypothetical protein